MSPHVPCPHCGEPALFAPANQWRPFCSERCKMIDLGAWANESYRIPVADPMDGPEAMGTTDHHDGSDGE